MNKLKDILTHFNCSFYSESFSIWFTLEIAYNNSSKCVFSNRCRIFLDNMVNGHIIMEGFYEKEVGSPCSRPIGIWKIWDHFKTPYWLTCDLAKIIMVSSVFVQKQKLLESHKTVYKAEKSNHWPVVAFLCGKMHRKHGRRGCDCHWKNVSAK